jgi:citrate lyase subunit beta/citryl-CoA lyase
MLEKARALPCDVVVLDLEDAVAPESKDAARAQVCAAVRNYGGRDVAVRINPLSSAEGKADLDAIRPARPDAILLPKVESPADINPARGDIPIWAMIETPKAVLHLSEIAAGGVTCLLLGTNDLLKSMRGQSLSDRRNLWAVLTQTVVAARAHGLGVIDGTYNDIGDENGFAKACAQGRAFGFDGKTLIHPSQIEAANRIFAPSPDEIAQAKRILDAFARNPGKGVIALDGRMIERLHAEEAQRLLALADAIAGAA